MLKKIGGIDGVVFEQNNINTNKKSKRLFQNQFIPLIKLSLIYVKSKKTKDYIEVCQRSRGLTINGW